MENIHVPYGCTVHGEEEIAAVTEVLRTSTQMGKNVREMEERIAKLFDKKTRYNGQFWFFGFVHSC